MKLTTKLDSDNIGGLVLGLALPSMAAQFVSVLYSIVDRMYIGNIPSIGETALAGVGVAGPIVTMISAFSFLIGMGGSPLVSIRLGKKQAKEAERILSNCFEALLALSLVIMAISYVLKDALLWRFGASPATFPYAEEYLRWYLSGTVFALMTIGMNQFVICQGYSRIAMQSVILGALLNIALDPIFIFVLGMNVKGAAAATVLSQLASCLYVVGFLFSKRSGLRIHLVWPDLKLIRRVGLLGSSSLLIIGFDNIMLIALNTMITKYGGADGDMLLTCNTILQSFMLIITMPLGGISGGTQTILGYNFGAGRPDKIKKAERCILALCLFYTVVLFAAAQLIPQFFIRIFTREQDYISMTSRIIRLYTIGVPVLSVQYMVVDGLSGMSLVRYALPLSAFRKALYFLCVFAIPPLFGVGFIFLAAPISDIIGAAVSGLFFLTKGQKVIESPVRD